MLRFKVFIHGLISELYFRITAKKCHQDIQGVYGDSLFVYAATIGELNAGKYLIQKLFEKYPNKKLVLFCGQAHYLFGFKEQYPDAIVLCPGDYSYFQHNTLFSRFKPSSLILIEGPGLHGRFPIRLNLDLPALCIKHNVFLYVINACLYKDYIGSKIDWLENIIFGDLHKQAITKWLVANEKFKESFVEEKIPSARIEIVGDIKFDAVFASELKQPSKELQSLLDFYTSQSPLIVAGSVKAPDEYQAIIRGWLEVKQEFPQAKLVLAPRYIQENRMMEPIYRYLDELKVNFAKRTEGLEQIKSSEMMVLDSFGELIYFYKLATMVIAGRNHGVLEPMRFGKPVIVGPEYGWDKKYPTSYYLYRFMLEKNALIQIDKYENTGSLFISLLKNETIVKSVVENINLEVKSQVGSVNRILSEIK